MRGVYAQLSQAAEKVRRGRKTISHLLKPLVKEMIFHLWQSLIALPCGITDRLWEKTLPQLRIFQRPAKAWSHRPVWRCDQTWHELGMGFADEASDHMVKIRITP